MFGRHYNEEQPDVSESECEFWAHKELNEAVRESLANAVRATKLAEGINRFADMVVEAESK